MTGLFEILDKIKTRPGMYLGTPSITTLFTFLVGYKTARRELGIEPTETEMRFYDEFQPWLQERLSIKTNNSWAALIQFRSINDKEAFDRFFELLDEFHRLNQSHELSSVSQEPEKVKAS